ncbi:MAG: DUF927 domain-containing protein [Bacilli bacterium]
MNENISEKDFIKLVTTDDKVEQAKLEIELRKTARENGIDKQQFNKMLYACKSKYGKKMFVDNEIIATNIPLPGLNGGSYACNDAGVSKDGIIVCYHPIIPIEIYRNLDSGKEKIKISFYKDNIWKSTVVDKSVISIASKIIYLSDKGVEVTSENSKLLVSYFNEIININKDKIIVKESVSHIGWNNDLFLPYDKAGIFDGVEEFKSIYNSLKEKGSYDKWFDTVKSIRAKKEIRIIMATTFASPLLEKLDVLPYVLNVFSSKSGSGKTVACMSAMSVWGCPKQGCLQFSTNNTANFYIRTSAFLRNITAYFDELQIIKYSKDIKMDSLVMDLCNGTERGRATKDNEIKEIKTWKNNFLFTNNERLAKENFGEQTYNRIIDMECKGQIIDNGREVVKSITNNYGFAGKIYLRYIKSVGFEAISERFKQLYTNILASTNSTEKQANSFASILVADELSTECLFLNETPLSIEDIKEFINDKDEIKTSLKAYEYLIDKININEKKFSEYKNGYGEIWGLKTDYNCSINKEVLVDLLKKGNFEFDSIKKEWVESGFLKKNSQGKYYSQTSVNGQKGNFVNISLVDLNNFQ